MFLALGIGVLLGVAIGENGVVSGASKDLERSLRGDLDSARSRNRDLRRELAIRDEYEQQTYEPLVKDLLAGWHVGVVALGELPGGYASDVSDAIEPAGAALDSVSVIKAPLPLGRLASEMKDTKLARLDRSTGSAGAVRGPDRTAARQRRADLIGRLRHDLFSSSRGEYRGLDGVVYVRDRRAWKARRSRRRTASSPDCIAGLKETKVALVGAETTGAEPSQVPGSWRIRASRAWTIWISRPGRPQSCGSSPGARRASSASRTPRSDCCRRRPTRAPPAARDHADGCHSPCPSGSPRCWRLRCSRGWSAPASYARTIAASSCPRPPGC